MATKISALPAAIAGAATDLLAAVQNGVTRRITFAALADWIIKIYPGYLPSGSGAIARTAQGKLQELKSVFDYIPESLHAGIVARTSTTDVASYIQDAIDRNQQCIIYFPAGTYMIGSSINFKTNRVLKGSFIGSIIKALSTWSPSVPTVTATATYTPVLSFSPLLYNKDAIDWWGIEDITLHGNDEDCYGLWLHENFHGYVKNVLVQNTNKRPYTNIRGQSVTHDNFTSYDCNAGVVTYDNTGLSFTGCGWERLAADWAYDQRQPNSFSKGGVVIENGWFESVSGATITSGFLRMSGRRNRVSAHFAFHDTATSEEMLKLNDNTASVVVDGITMDAQACARGRFNVNDAASTLYMSAATNTVGNIVEGAYTVSRITDSGTGNSFNVNSGLSTAVQHVTTRFQVRAISTTAAQFAIDADWNAGSPEVRLCASASNKFGLSGAILRLSSASSLQLNPSGSVSCIQTNGCFLPPTLTTVQRDAVTAANSMIEYNSNRGSFEGRIAGTWRALRGGQISADNGDAAATLVVASDEPTQIWATALGADRAVALSTTNAENGDRFRIVRKASATGAFNLNVGTGPLKALGIGEWCDVEYDGSAWFLSSYGAL